MILCPICKSRLTDRSVNPGIFVCENCLLAIRKEENQAQSRDSNLYNEQWARHEEDKPVNLKTAHRRLYQIKKLGNVERVLDIGCGTGILVDLLAQNGYLVDGIDSSRPNINYAKKIKKGNYFLQDIKSFNGKDKYDLIIAAHFIEHLGGHKEFFDKIKSLLNKNGLLYIATPNFSACSSKSFWRESIDSMYGTDHKILYSFKSLSNLLLRNNYKILFCTTKTYSPRIIDGLIKKYYSKHLKNLSALKTNCVQSNTSDHNIRSIKNIKKQSIIKLKTLYKLIINSLIIDLLLYIPNRISEIRNRGEELIILAILSK